MRLVSYVKTGQQSFGMLVPGGLIDLADVTGCKTLKEAIASGVLEMLSEDIDTPPAEFSLADVTLLPVIPDPAKIMCIGVNYHDHRKETGRPKVDHPTVFVRYPDSQIAHRQPLIKPSRSERFDFEGEMAIVIGEGGRNITKDTALNHVAGYACYVDGSVRNYQRHSSQFLPGKTFPGTGAFGPCLVTPDEVGDYRDLVLQTRLNGETVQEAPLSDMIFPVEELIEYCSQFTPLSAGDVIVTGTPGGVGDKREPPLYMQEGDVLEVEIGLLGTLVNPVVAEDSL